MKTVPIRHVADVWTSSVDKHTVDGEIPVQLCNYTDAYKNDRVRPGPTLMRATATADEIRRHRLKIGDSVFTKDSEDPDDIGISAFVDGEADDFVCGYHLAIARPFPSTHGRYLNWALRSRPVREHFGTHSAGISRYGIALTDLRSAPIPLLPLSEQRRIADFLDDRVSRIDRIIAARREQMVRAREGFESSRRSLVLGDNSPDPRPTDLPWAQSVGGDRVVRRLAQMATMGTGHTPSRSNADYWVDCTIPWLTTGDVHRFRRDEIVEIHDPELLISAVGLANSAAVLHPAGTVALSRTASAGFSIIMGADMATSQDYVTWTCGPDLEPEFLLASLRVMRPFLLGYLATGSTHKTIYFPDLMDLRLPVPPVATQRKAVEQLRAVADAYWSGNQAMGELVRLLTEYKSSLITAAVTGELDVTTAGLNIPG